MPTSSCSISNFALKIMLHFFDIDELLDSRSNVKERGSNGISKNMLPLDQTKMYIIKKAIFNSIEGDCEIKEDVWKKAGKAMTKTLSDLRQRTRTQWV